MPHEAPAANAMYLPASELVHGGNAFRVRFELVRPQDLTGVPVERAQHAIL